MGSVRAKAAIVTGATGAGIGGATARRLAGTGISLFLTSVGDTDDLSALVSECRGADVDVEFGHYDFTQDESAERMVSDALGAFGRVDILVNNAGMRNHKPFGSYSGAEFDELVAVNLRAPFLASQAVIPTMRSQGEGRIIHVASQMGVVTANHLSLYSATKAALISLARSMALELASEGISVNAVSPGPVATGYLEARFAEEPELREAFLAGIPLGRFGVPDEVAEVIHFLATCEGRLIQGHNLIADGGYVIH